MNEAEIIGTLLRFLIGAALLLYGLSSLYRAEDGCNRRKVVGFALTLAGLLLFT